MVVLRPLWLPLFIIALSFALPVKDAAAAVSITGSWNMTLSHPDLTYPAECTAAITQTGTSLSASMTCTQLGSGSFSGSINTSSGAFALSGTLGGQPVTMMGNATNSSMSGTWTIAPLSANGTFTGTPSAVGGFTELSQQADTPLKTPEHSRNHTALIATLAAALGALTLGGAAWYARQRR